MSLVNDYLKRLGRKSLSSAGRGEGMIPPALQRIQKGSRDKVTRKKYLRYSGIAVAIYCVGYFLFFVITLWQQPVDNKEMVEETSPSLSSSTAPTTAATQGTSTEVTADPSAVEMVQQAGVEEGGQTTPAVGVAPGQDKTRVSATTAPTRQEEKTGVEVQDKVNVPATAQGKADPVVEAEEQTVESSGIREEPYPLPGTGREATASMTPSGAAEVAANRVVFTESQNKPAYYYQIALQAQHNDNFGMAEQYYREVLEEEPGHENALINLSAIYIQENRLSEADALLQKAIKRNPKNPKALVNAGMIALQQKKNEVAADHFHQALQYNPIEETALVNLAYLAEQEKQYDTAISYYQKLVRISPAKTNFLLAYAGLEEKKQQYASAIDLYRRCLDQMSMQKQPELYARIKQRIQILRQYASRQAYRDSFKLE